VAGLIGISSTHMEIVDALQVGKWEFEGTWAPRPVVRLTNALPAAVRRGKGVAIVRARWGIPVGPTRVVGNARDDRLIESPMWARMLGRQPCLMVATDIFEQVREPAKQAYAFRRADGKPIVMPGLFDERAVKGEKRICCAIVTTEPNEFFARFHDRQVCSLDRDEAAAWMAETDPRRAAKLLHAPEDDEWEAVPVFDRVFARDRRDAEGLKTVGPPVRWADVRHR
jgi:putative SOS response-associated peptidase YedK